MKKQARMEAFVAGLGADASLALDPCYQGYFRCFNEGRYYEAHDVLEHLWLANGRADANFAFYKGLIQVAGAFVHLQKQAARPGHPKDGRRLRPATRLFALAMANLAEYGPRHLALDVDALCALCAGHMAAMAASEFTHNPWSPASAPRLVLDLR
jgi:predicted metal-dependent hydrolase